MGLTKEHFRAIINQLVTKLESDNIVYHYILNHPEAFEYQSNFLSYCIDGKLVKFINLVSDYTYLTQSEKITLLNDLLVDATEVTTKAYESKILLEYYLSKINNL